MHLALGPASAVIPFGAALEAMAGWPLTIVAAGHTALRTIAAALTQRGVGTRMGGGLQRSNMKGLLDRWRDDVGKTDRTVAFCDSSRIQHGAMVLQEWVVTACVR